MAPDLLSCFSTVAVTDGSTYRNEEPKAAQQPKIVASRAKKRVSARLPIDSALYINDFGIASRDVRRHVLCSHLRAKYGLHRRG